ncbi:hypothetical protein BH09VER1_BH09VER1_14520 [soil metagenome]
MLAEDKVPLDERYLVIKGRLSDSIFEAVHKGLPKEAEAADCFFSRYTYADLPLPKRFDVVFDYPERRTVEHASTTILASTQQLAFPDTKLPHGWKMICWFGKDAAVSHLLTDLPIVDSWFESPKAVSLAKLETWEKIAEGSQVAERNFEDFLGRGMPLEEVLRELYIHREIKPLYLYPLAASSLRISIGEAIKFVVQKIMCD